MEKKIFLVGGAVRGSDTLNERRNILKKGLCLCAVANDLFSDQCWKKKD
jgi:hypothetical protein